MKIRILPTALLCLIAPMAAFAADDSPSELDDTMEQLNTAYRKLTRQVSNPARNADSLQAVATVRERAIEAMKMEPKKKADVPAAQQAKFVTDFRAKMKDFLAEVDKLEASLKAGKNDEAASVLKSLKQFQEDGHKEFKRGKDDKKKG